jgi:hypothetical protein
MWTDATGEVHFEFWDGIKLNGKTFQSLPLFNLCREFGNAQVLKACTDLGCYPYAADLKAIKDECQRQENSYV